MLTSKQKLTKTLTQNINNKESEDDDEDDLSVEINDKLSELWTGMRNKRKLMMRNLTPGNSRRSEQTLSSIKNNNNNNNNRTNTSTKYNESNWMNKNDKYKQEEESFVLTTHMKKNNRNINNEKKKSEEQIINMKNLSSHQQQQLEQEQENKETLEIRRLKQTIDKLSHDNSELMEQLKNCFKQTGSGAMVGEEEYYNDDQNNNNNNAYDNDNGEVLNECTEIEVRENYSIDNNDNNYDNNERYNQEQLAIVDGRTANFYQQQQQKEYEMHNHSKNKHKTKSKHNKKSFISVKNDVKCSKSIKKNNNNKNKRESLLGLSAVDNDNNSRNRNNIEHKNITTTIITTNKENTNPNNYNSNNNLIMRNHSHNSHHSHSNTITPHHPTTIFPNEQSLETLSHHRLIQLLKSTTEYRQFAYYYDSHELSYLKRLQHMHKKNCHINPSEKELKYWVPTELLTKMKEANVRNEWGLKEEVIEEIIGEMKCYYERNLEMKLNEQRDFLMKKIHKLKREKENNVPYDLVRLTNAKERESSVVKKTSENYNNNNNITNKNNHNKSTSIRC